MKCSVSRPLFCCLQRRSVIAICFGCKTKTSKNILYDWRTRFAATIGLQVCFTNRLSSRPQLPDRAISPSARTISPDKVRFHSPQANFTHFFRNNPEKVKAPGLRRPGAFLCSLKNEGYNYESLFRLALRRVEQLYSDGCGSVFLSTLILNNANMKTV